jgi:hypothetical protein
MWTVWPERNRLSFTTCKPKVISIFKMQIISFVQYLCSQEGKVDMLKLTLVLPQNVSQSFHTGSGNFRDTSRE